MQLVKIFLMFLFLTFPAAAQNWNAVLNINPYPSPYTSDWETNPSSVGSLTLFNNTNEPADIIITATVTHQSYGVVAMSITSPIQISSAPTTIIDNTSFISFPNAQFPQQNLKDQVLQTGRLPEGQYTVCLNIENTDNQILVNSICANFTIIYPEPPHIVYPMNGDSLNADNEYPTFQWTPVIVPPDYQLTYTLKIVEVFQGQTPAQALSANYPQYINNQINITSFTYPIDALKLENGKTFAWQIQALDQFGLPPAQNQGKSEIFTFTKKKFIIFPIFIINNPLLQSPSNNNQIASNKPTFKWSYTPAQGENYKFGIKICKINTGQTPADAINNLPLYSTIISSNQTSFTPPVYLNFSQNAGYVWRVDVINSSDNTVLKSSDVWKFTYSQGIVINPVFTFPAWSFLSGQLRYKYAYKYDTESWHLPNRTVKLVIKYVLKYNSFSGTGNYGSTFEAPKGELLLKDDDIPGHPSDNNKTLAVTTTDVNGNFHFNFINPDSMKLIKANYYFSKGGEFGYDYTGGVYRVARIIVEDQYFTSPDDDIIIQPYETKNIGSVTSLIRSYAFEVTIKPWQHIEQQFTLQPLDQMDVYLLRKKRPYGLPNTEGSPKPSIVHSGYEVVAMGTTGENGTIIFTRLISNIAEGDNYYIYARSNKNAHHNYILFEQYFYFSDWHRSDGKHYSLTDKSGNTYYSKDESPSVNTDNAIYNSQYKQPIVHRDFEAFPLLPEISGLVVRSDEPGTKINNATVQLMKIIKTTNWYGYTYIYNIVEKTFKTDATGYFYFGGLNVEYSPVPPYEINGPVRQLWGSAEGFDSKILAVDGSAQNNALSLGERKSNQLLALNPGSIVSGNIVDEYGNGLDARIKIGDAPVKTVHPNGYYYDIKNHKLVIAPAHFEFPAARLKHQSLVVTPLYNASQYIIDTSYVDITQSNQNLGDIIVYEKKHRIHFIVKESQPWTPTFEHPSPPVYQWPPLPGAKIKINIMGSYSEKTTDQYGEASFEFSNDAVSFKVIVEGPAGKYYVKKVAMVQNKPSKYDVPYVVVLDKATYISGSVFVAGNKPVENADVWIDFGNPDLNISVKTDEIGEYILPNVPIEMDVIVYASKHSNKHSNTETIIGDSVAVHTTENGKTGVDLYLTIYNGMDITQLLGFPVLLTNLTEEGNGQVRITGLINTFKNNNIFDLSDPQNSRLSFKNVLIKPGNKKNSKGVPYAALASPPLIFNDPFLSLNMFKKFNADFGDTQNGIKLINPGNDIGLLKGKLFVSASSFDTKGSLSDYNGLYLANPDVQNNTKKMLVSAITADGSAPLNIPNGFNVTNSTGGSLTLKINNFNAETDPHKSFFNQDTVRLRTTLHTNIAHANPSDLKLAIGDVVFHQKSIDPVIGTKGFSFKLDKWTLDASEWNFYKGNIKITKGIFNAGLNIPVKTLDVTPTSLAFGDFNLSSITVSKIVPFTITGKFYFNHDDANDYWYLSVSKKNLSDPYAAYAKGLPGMANNDLLKISSFVLNSKESFFSLTPENQTLKIYKVGILNLNASNPLLAYDNYLYVQGLGFNIPNATQSTAFDYYKGNDSKIAFKLRGINLSANAGNGVYIKFGATPEQQNSQVLDESGFRSIGVIGEEGKFEKVSWLYHTVDSTSILVETPTTPFTTRNTYQKMRIGSSSSTYLSKLTGGMIVSNNKWNNFHFEGDLTGTKGITDKHKRLAFTVYGKILADNQQISVKDVPTPFGKMKWVYEFENSRLIGTFDIHKNLGGVKIDGTSEILIDGMGWYFLAGGTMEVPGIGPGYAAMIFGDYPSIPQPVKDKFAEASYNKNLPSSFQKNISGFLFSGAMSVPVIIPHININLGIFALGFGVDAGGDIKIYKGFDEGGSTYGIGTLAFIHAFLLLKSVTCTTISGDATLEAGMDGNYQTGSGTFNLNGCASLSISGHIIQLTPNPITFCGKPVILDIGDTFAFSAKFHVDSDGNTSLKFKKGTCSGN